MKIFVTGATGFLGSHLCKALDTSSNSVVAVGSNECNLTEERSLKKYQDTQFDLIFHLAAWTQAGDFCLHHPGEQWIINQKINTNMLSWWSDYQPQAKMICLGTSCAYDPNLPLSEKYYLKGEPIESLFTYAMTKRMLLNGLHSLSQQFGHNYLYAIPSTLYGSDYHTDGRQMHFIFDLIVKILRGKHFGEKVVLWGDGYQRRELIHVKDFVSALLSIHFREQNTLINIGAGCDYTIREFAEIICKIIDYPFDAIHFDKSKYVGARSKLLDTSKLVKLLPNLKLTPLAQGIEETCLWVKEKLFLASGYLNN